MRKAKENERKQTHLSGPGNRLGLGQVISAGSIFTGIDAMPEYQEKKNALVLQEWVKTQ